MKNSKRESHRKPKKLVCPFPELCGKLFHPSGYYSERVWVLLFHPERGWVLAHAWGGYKGYNPFEPRKMALLDGYVDSNLYNADNYYEEDEIKTSAKTPEGVLNAVKSLGYAPCEEMAGAV